MKILHKMALVSIIISFAITGASCRTTPNNNNPDIGFSCQRLNSCYANYGKLLGDQNLKVLIESAQKSGDEIQCSAAIAQFSSAVKQECPF